jgi:hypothetical protein
MAISECQETSAMMLLCYYLLQRNMLHLLLCCQYIPFSFPVFTFVSSGRYPFFIRFASHDDTTCMLFSDIFLSILLSLQHISRFDFPVG